MSICALLPVTGMGGAAEHEAQPKQQKHSQNSMDCNAGHGYIPSLEVLESYKEILGEISKNRVNADHIYLNPRTWPAHGPHMARTWPAHGPHMARTWPAHGPHMARTWHEPKGQSGVQRPNLEKQSV
jgi:hypothetical protein